MFVNSDGSGWVIVLNDSAQWNYKGNAEFVYKL